MECAKHEIHIDNFKPREHVTYSLIIIKGHLKNINCDQIHDQQDIILNPAKDNLRFPIVSDKFKAITELSPGENLIELKYCDVVITFIINLTQRQSEYSILPLYIICEGHDGSFQAPETEKSSAENACQRITLGSKLLQSVIAEKLYEEELERKTFKLESNCQVFNSKLNYEEARRMTQEELWATLGREIVNSELGAGDRRKFLAFISCTRYRSEDYDAASIKTHEDILSLTEAHAALGGGGLALFGSACIFTWPEDCSQIISRFQDETPIDRSRFMDDSCYRGNFGACFSTTLGSVLHELCHIFDLGHTEYGIMGRGFDDISKIFQCNSREISSSNIREIQFREKLDSQVLLSERLQERKKDYSFSVKTGEDDIFWTKSCLMILAYHRFLNDFKECDNVIKLDSITKVVSSIKGLRVIEIRDVSNEFVIKNWIFPGRVLKFSFQISGEIFRDSRDSYLIFVEDNVGNILKETCSNDE